jgi:hypothetical protein
MQFRGFTVFFSKKVTIKTLCERVEKKLKLMGNGNELQLQLRSDQNKNITYHGRNSISSNEDGA